MAAEDAEDAETTLDENYAITVPPEFRRQLDLEPGDRLRWRTTDDGRLVAEQVSERYGVAEDLEPIDAEVETDAVVETEERGYEFD